MGGGGKGRRRGVVGVLSESTHFSASLGLKLSSYKFLPQSIDSLWFCKILTQYMYMSKIAKKCTCF